MQTKFMYQNESVRILSLNPASTTDILNPAIYSIQFNPITGFYLDIIQDALKIPKIIHGDVQLRVDKCLKAYNSRAASTGILLTGDKGTGKTLFMSLLANHVMNDLALPVILVRSAYSGDQFESFLQKLGECCLLFDEFGKLYSKNNSGEDTNNQSALLGLLDGIDKTKRLIILTENSELSINNYLLNRPSRIFYHFKYQKLDDKSITDFCDYNQVSEKIKNGILDICHRSFTFSFDNLQCIVEECKRFKTLPREAVKDLNIDVSVRPIYIKIVKIEIKGQPSEKDEKFKIVSPLVPKPDQDNDDNSVVRFSKPGRSEAYDLLQDKEITKNLSTEVLNLLKSTARERNEHNVYIDEGQLIFEDSHKLVYDADGYIITAEKTNKVPRTNYSQFY